MRIAVVGCGTMGAMHVRAIGRQPQIQLVGVVDRDPDRAEPLARQADCAWGTDVSDLPEAVDGVIVASSTDEHFGVVSRLLDLEEPPALLVEKPLAATAADAEALVSAAGRFAGRILVGHIERFNAAVRELVRWKDSGLVHVEMRRLGPSFRTVDTHVVHDLMIHDLDILTQLIGRDFAGICSVTSGDRPGAPNIASALLRSEQGITASLTASRIAQLKERTITLTCEGVQVVADLVTQQVSIHRTHHQEFSEEGASRFRRSGVVEIPYLEIGEPLLAEHRHFLDVIAGRAEPLVSLRDAADVVGLCDRVVAAACDPGTGAGPITSARAE